MPKSPAHSNHRVRREVHRLTADILRGNKRLRRQRREIHEALERASRVSAAQTAYQPPFVCEKTKHADGWRVLDQSGQVGGLAKSRDAQRVLRDSLNAVDPPSVLLDELMLELGYERIGDTGHVEQRWRKVT